MAPSKLRLDYMDLAVLMRAPRNPKEHDLGALQESFERFGFVAPLILDDTTGQLVVGHGRLEALQQRKASGAPAPERVVVKGDSWLVPVIRGLHFMSPTDAESYLVADNRLTMLGGWNDAALSALLSDLAAQQSLDGTGFDADDVDALLASVASATKPKRVPKALAVQEGLRYQVIVSCADEATQKALLERFTADGLDCRALIS